MFNRLSLGAGRTTAMAATTAAVLGIVSVGVSGSAAVAAPAPPVHYSFSDPTTTEVLPCGAIWTYTGTHSGTLFPNAAGDGFTKVVQQDYYPGTITYQGKTYTTNDRQVDITTVAADGSQIGHLNGQGLFTRLPGIGVVVSDTGHLVFDEATAQTIKGSAKVIPLDQSFDYGAAVCAALTGSTP